MATQVRVKGFVVGSDTRSGIIGVQTIWKVRVKDEASEHDGQKFMVMSAQQDITLAAGLNVTFMLDNFRKHGTSVRIEETELRAVDVRLYGPQKWHEAAHSILITFHSLLAAYTGAEADREELNMAAMRTQLADAASADQDAKGDFATFILALRGLSLEHGVPQGVQMLLSHANGSTTGLECLAQACELIDAQLTKTELGIEV